MEILKKLKPVRPEEMRGLSTIQTEDREGIWPFRTAIYRVIDKRRGTDVHEGRYRNGKAAIKSYIRSKR